MSALPSAALHQAANYGDIITCGLNFGFGARLAFSGVPITGVRSNGRLEAC